MAYDFDGQSDHLTAPGGFLHGECCTISAWCAPGFDPDDIAPRTLFDSTGTHHRLQFGTASDEASVHVAGHMRRFEVAAAWNADQWIPVVVTFNREAQAIALYIRGIPCVSTGSNGTWAGKFESDNFALGAEIRGKTPWLGKIAHVAVWSRVLSLQEIRAHAKGIIPSQVAPTGLLPYWSLEGRLAPLYGPYDFQKHGQPEPVSGPFCISRGHVADVAPNFDSPILSEGFEGAGCENVWLPVVDPDGTELDPDSPAPGSPAWAGTSCLHVTAERDRCAQQTYRFPAASKLWFSAMVRGGGKLRPAEVIRFGNGHVFWRVCPYEIVFGGTIVHYEGAELSGEDRWYQLRCQLDANRKIARAWVDRNLIYDGPCMGASWDSLLLGVTEESSEDVSVYFDNVEIRTDHELPPMREEFVVCRGTFIGHDVDGTGWSLVGMPTEQTDLDTAEMFVPPDWPQELGPTCMHVTQEPGENDVYAVRSFQPAKKGYLRFYLNVKHGAGMIAALDTGVALYYTEDNALRLAIRPEAGQVDIGREPLAYGKTARVEIGWEQGRVTFRVNGRMVGHPLNINSVQEPFRIGSMGATQRTGFFIGGIELRTDRWPGALPAF